MDTFASESVEGLFLSIHDSVVISFSVIIMWLV